MTRLPIQAIKLQKSKDQRKIKVQNAKCKIMEVIAASRRFRHFDISFLIFDLPFHTLIFAPWLCHHAIRSTPAVQERRFCVMIEAVIR